MAAIRSSKELGIELRAVGSLYVVPEWDAGGSALGDDLDFAEIAIDVVYDEQLRRFAVHSVHVERVGEGSEVTGAILRDIRVQDRVQKNALANIWLPYPTKLSTVIVVHDGKSLYPAFAVLEELRPVSGRTTDDDAIAAATIHQIASVAYMPPLQTISRVLETSQSTAKRLVARARDLGLLPDGDD